MLVRKEFAALLGEPSDARLSLLWVLTDGTALVSLPKGSPGAFSNKSLSTAFPNAC